MPSEYEHSSSKNSVLHRGPKQDIPIFSKVIIVILIEFIGTIAVNVITSGK
jgi:hypothetical protein